MNAFNKIYVLCPKALVTGGTEALHQLVDAINRHGGQAFIVYYAGQKIGVRNFVPLKFRHYKIRVLRNIDDIARNAVVAPEIDIEFLSLYKKASKYIWWLSVDYGSKIDPNWFKMDDVTHLYQSYYAKEFLVKKGVTNLKSLSDYVVNYPITQMNKKKEIIAICTSKLDKRYEEVIEKIEAEFETVSIKSLSRIGLSKLFNKSCVIVDFGMHPGKDRLIREATLMNNFVIVSQNGACNNVVDVPIDNDSKISATNSDVINLIRNLISSDFEFSNGRYKKKVKNEKFVFFKEVRECFHLPECDRKVTLVGLRFQIFSLMEHIIIKLGMGKYLR
ncbi:MAG: hypothetical protein H6607_12830 [Flavobacteriales bacterium]|nr:hypothetical protein [Flavobacteriales bacterium]